MTVKQNTLGWGLGTVGAAAMIAAMTLISTQSQARKISAVHAANAVSPANIEMWVSTLDADTAAPVFDHVNLIKDAAKSELDIKCLSEAIYYEARSETSKGQKAVAEVVMNRVSSRHYPNSICEVVYQGSARKHGCQFSFTCDGSMTRPRKAKTWARSQGLAQHMVMGLSKPQTNNATHYHTNAVSPRWSKTLVSVGTIGSHKFYQNRRRPVAKTTTAVAP